ncbi:PrsW family intramembrane metalloprotease [Nostoc sp.]|uniref:PrsW family intramembrane metalloprotease n=1 Tax=Nostoc sp. TaxID=1180 RepID=UPI002FF5C8FD
MLLTNQARLFYGSPLSRPRNAVLISIVLAVLIAISASSLIKQFSRVTPVAFQVFFIAVAATILLTLFTLAILWFLDRREPESRWLYLIAVLWGALIATGLALPISGYMHAAVDSYVKVHPNVQAILGADAGKILGAPIAAPLVEDTTKGLGVLLLFWLLRAEFDGVRDGFIYGALIGLGFNLFEAPLFVMRTFIQTGDAPLAFQLGDRFAVFGLDGHPLYAGLFGMGLGLARQTTRRWLRYAAPVGGWLLGYSAHFLNDALVLIVYLYTFITTGKPLHVESTPGDVSEMTQSFFSVWVSHSALRLLGFFPFFLIVGVMLWQSGIWERQVIREGLADETEPVITPEEYEQVKGDRIFRTRRIPHLKGRTSRAIVRAQNELAIRKWRVKHIGQSVESDPLVASWRDELLRLRG